MDMSINAHEKNENRNVLWVWFEGSTALLKGQGVCYNWDYGTATASDARRTNRVEVPTILNARYFAGVAARAYSAKTGGQFIEVNGPGSYCEILAAATTVRGTGELTCEAGGTYAGYFRYRGFEGEGTAVPLQSVSGTVGSPLVCLAKLQEGPPSGLVEDVATNTDGLLDGGATTFMIGGVSYISADISTGGDATFTLADGTTSGLKKAFVCQSSQTNDVVINVTSGIEGVANADPTNALATVKLNADLEETMLQWRAFDTNGLWYIQHTVGATIA